MSIARLEHSAPARRPVRLAGAGLLAALALAVVASPALGFVGPAPASAFAPGAMGWDGPSRPTRQAASDTTPASPAPSSSPAPSAAPDPSASPAPSPSDPASPAPTSAPTPQPTPAWSKAVTTVGSSIRFYGRGYGHGVGMSQWGARGRALAGQGAGKILAAYFQGTTVGATSPTRAVRVLVLSGFAAAVTNPLTIHGRTGPWTVTGAANAFPADAALTVWRTTATASGMTTTTWHLQVKAADDGAVLYTGTPTGSVVISPAAPSTALQLNSKPSAYDLYRGTLTLRLGASSLSVVNGVALDDYLRGVVPVEMPASWPVEALKAQAIVARSWTVRHLHPTTGWFDVYDDSRSQVYRGVRAENAGVNALINAAPGAVLLSGTAVVNAFYDASAGGWTESNQYGFVPASGIVSATPLPYLRGVDDRAPNGIAYDAAAPGYRWSTASISHARLNAILGADSRTRVGTVLRLDLTHRGISGRLYQVVIYGSTATKRVSGDVFRAVYNAHRPSGTAPLRSNLFSVTPLP